MNLENFQQKHTKILKVLNNDIHISYKTHQKFLTFQKILIIAHLKPSIIAGMFYVSILKYLCMFLQIICFIFYFLNLLKPNYNFQSM